MTIGIIYPVFKQKVISGFQFTVNIPHSVWSYFSGLSVDSWKGWCSWAVPQLSQLSGPHLPRCGHILPFAHPHLANVPPSGSPLKFFSRIFIPV